MPRSTLFVLVAVLVAGCSDPGPAADPHADEIARLTQAVEELRDANSELATEVRRQGRQLAGLGRVRIETSDPSTGFAPPPAPERTGAAATSAGASEDAAALDADHAPDEAAVAAFLATEPGREAIQRATAREIEAREEKDRRLSVSYQIGMFARKAGLDDRQTERLQQIWKESLDGGVELRKQFAAIGALPESEREEARGKAMQTMRNLGQQRRESVAEILSGQQLELYEKTDEEIVSGLHGGPRR